jgi:predicted kinase
LSIGWYNQRSCASDRLVSEVLIIFGGLPGTGKSSIARELAGRLRAVHLRIDTIEQAIRSSGVLTGDLGPAGYVAAYRLAVDNLRLA